LIGAGTYADDALGACSATGYGEGILRAVAAYRGVVRAAELGPAGSCLTLIEELTQRWHAPAGLICVAPDGRIGWARSTATMSWGAAWQTPAAWQAAVPWSDQQVLSGF
jgi:beta-aspartyl-peptidase (threonine type)